MISVANNYTVSMPSRLKTIRDFIQVLSKIDPDTPIESHVEVATDVDSSRNCVVYSYSYNVEWDCTKPIVTDNTEEA